jgi:hypothetical protein
MGSLAALLGQKLAVRQEEAVRLLYCTAELRDVFVGLVKEVFVLHKLAHSSFPPTQIIRRGNGALLDDFCEPVEGCNERGFKPSVSFMTMPGFKLGAVIVRRCQIYKELES